MKVRLYNFVKQISLQLKLDTNYFLRGTLWGTIQQLIGVSSGLFVSYLFGHFTTKVVFGQYNLILSYLSLLTFISLPGIDTALVRSIGQGFDHSLVLGIRKKILFSSLGIPLLIIAGIYYIAIAQPELGWSLIISSIFFPLLYSFTPYSAFLTAKRQFKMLAVINVSASLLFLIIHAIGILYFSTTIILIVCFLLARTIADITGFILTRHFIQTTKKDPTLVSYGSFLTAVNILPWISGHIGSIVLGSLLGPEALAIYAVSNRFLVAVQKNFVVFYKPVTAKLAAQTSNEHYQVLKTHGLKLLLIGLGIAASLYVATPYLISFFFTNTYAESIRYGQLLSLALIPLPFSWTLTDMIIYQKKKQVQILLSIVPHVIKIILYILLIPRLGILALVMILLLERFTDPLIPLWAILIGARKK